MAHSVGEQAARAVKNSQKVAVEKRTPEEILKTIRGNIAARLFVTPTDQRFLLTAYDDLQSKLDAAHALLAQSTNVIKFATEASELANAEILKLRAQVADLRDEAIRRENDRQAEKILLLAKIEEFRTVYEQENRSTTLRVDVLDPSIADHATAIDEA